MRVLTLLSALLVVLASSSFAESFASWIKSAEKAEGRNQPARAVECYANALRMWKRGDGNDARLGALKAKAASHAALRQWSDAIRDLSDALSLAAKDKELLLRRGRAYVEARRERKAVADLNAAIAIDIDYKEAYFERARAHQRLGDKAFSKEDFRHACELGLKEACPAPATGGPAPNPKDGSAKKPAPPADDKSDPLDAPACFASLNKCLDDGDSYGSCVSKLEPCEKNPVKGCCPEVCRKKFSKIQEEEGVGEAEAFRRVFHRGNACLKRR